MIVRPILLHDYETWLLKIGDIYRLLVFGDRCLRIIARTYRSYRVSNAEIRCRVLGNYGKNWLVR